MLVLNLIIDLDLGDFDFPSLIDILLDCDFELDFILV